MTIERGQTPKEEEIKILQEVVPLETLVSTGMPVKVKELFFLPYLNRRMAKGLIWELNPPSATVESNDTRHKSIYTFRDCKPGYYMMKDGIPRYDLNQLYLMCSDLNEYAFANMFFWDWSHWELVLKNRDVKENISRLRQELEYKTQAELLQVLVLDANDPNSKTRTSSAKYLRDQYLKEGKVKRSQGKQINTSAPTTLENKEELEALERVLKGFTN